MNKEKKDLLHKSLRGMGLGFSGSQVDWIEDFIEEVEQQAREEERRKMKREIEGLALTYSEVTGTSGGGAYLKIDYKKVFNELRSNLKDKKK